MEKSIKIKYEKKVIAALEKTMCRNCKFRHPELGCINEYDGSQYPEGCWKPGIEVKFNPANEFDWYDEIGVVECNSEKYQNSLISKIIELKIIIVETDEKVSFDYKKLNIYE